MTASSEPPRSPGHQRPPAPREHVGTSFATEARWTDLRDKLTRDAAAEQELGDDYSEMGTEESLNTAYKHWGKAEALREVLAWMDRAGKEADQ